VLLPRFGFVLGGGGDAEQECEGSTPICNTLNATADDYDDESDPLIGFDLLGHLSHNLRLGAGLTWVTGTSVDIDGVGSQQDLGSDLSLQAIVEGLIDVGPQTAIAVRAQGGAILLIVGGDLENEIEGLEQDCESIETAGGSCEVKDGPFLGWTVGGAAGVVHSLGDVALRADFMLQFYALRTAGQDVSIGGEDVETTFVLTGNRFVLTAGLEF
jgi:hypothetical protein